jgi:hypothetical protein
MAVGVLIAAWCVRLRRLGRSGKLPALTTEQRAVETTLVLSIVALLLFRAPRTMPKRWAGGWQ